jgi:hypothetical protein
VCDNIAQNQSTIICFLLLATASEYLSIAIQIGIFHMISALCTRLRLFLVKKINLFAFRMSAVTNTLFVPMSLEKNHSKGKKRKINGNFLEN